MAKSDLENETARLEARIPLYVYEQMQRAARLKGMTLTGYLIATAGEEARRAVSTPRSFASSVKTKSGFAEALIDPPKPNKCLIRAVKRHAETIERR